MEQDYTRFQVAHNIKQCKKNPKPFVWCVYKTHLDWHYYTVVPPGKIALTQILRFIQDTLANTIHNVPVTVRYDGFS